LHSSIVLVAKIRHKKKEELNKMEIAMTKKNIYQFKVEDLSGNTLTSQVQGKIMIVNTVKMWTDPQYKDLEAIYKQYQDKDFVIVFLQIICSQEPGTNEEIAFCQMNYGASFQ
jgi:glutathione peroxidase